MKESAILAIAAMSVVVVADRLYAQEARSTGIEEVIVTAQKRVESAQDTPIAVDVVSGESLVREGIRDVKDLNKISTELEINSGAGQAQMIGLRGMQQTGFAQTGETLTAVHLDGAYQASFWGLNALLFDVQRVEVLAGPQGTLYGRNAAAGAINIITNRPGQELEGNLWTDFGSENTARIGGGVSMPLGDEFSLRIAGQRYTRDALFTEGSAEQDQWGIRASGVWSPSDVDEVYFTVDHLDFAGTNDPTTLLAINANARLPNGTTPASVTSYLNSPTLADPYNLLPYYNQRGLVFDGNNWQKNDGLMIQYTHDFEGFSGVFQYGRRDFQNVSRASARPATAYAGQFLFPIDQTTNSAEFRLLSETGNALEWVAGVFYYESTSQGWAAIPFTGNVPDPFVGLTPGCPCSFGFWPNSGDAESYAAFGQGRWTPDTSDRLHLTLGLRYSHDWKNAMLGYWAGVPIYAFGVKDMPPAAQALFAGLPDGASSSSTGTNEKDWDAIQYKLGLEYDVTDSSMLYGSISTGYKAGGFTYGPTPELDPEDLLAFEIGTKNRFRDNTLQLNASLWWYDYQDLEAGVPRLLGYDVVLPGGNVVNAANSTTNVGQVDMGGIATDIDWLATDNDQFGLSVTYVYSKIKDGTEVTQSGQRNIVFNEGERIGDAPEWNVLGRYSRTFNLASGALLNPQFKYQWQSEKYNAGSFYAVPYAINNRLPRETEIPSRGILDVSLRFSPASGNWDLTAYVNNATDELNVITRAYSDNPSAANAIFGHITGTIGEPRTYGLILNARF
jgi:iron complex outermembrane recepter protein